MEPFPEILAQFLSPAKLEKIRKARVGIAGAGGLGSNVAMMLVRCGFQDFVISDFDTVAPSNLNRQFYFADQLGQYKVDVLRKNLLRIHPNCKVDSRRLRIDASNIGEVFDRCSVLVEAFDNVESKMAFVQTVRSVWPDRFLVTASGMAGWGNTDAICTREVHSNFVIVGDQETSVNQAPPMAPRVMIAAAKEADAVLNFVLRDCADED